MNAAGGVLRLAFLVPAIVSLWQPAVPGQSRIATDFGERIKAYHKLREEALREAPRISRKADPEQISEHRRGFARALRLVRAGARQGDIFTPLAAAEFKRIIAAETTGPARQSTRRAVKVGNPAVEGDLSKFKIAVNADYPGDQPLSMVPPNLLLRLPELPKGLEYRFVGRDLVLLDTEPGLIVDYIPEAMP